MKLVDYLFDKHLINTKRELKELINYGLISINGDATSNKDAIIDITDQVSIKKNKQYFLNYQDDVLYSVNSFDIDLTNKTILNVELSTSIFTPLLIDLNAKKIIAIDNNISLIDDEIIDNEIFEYHTNELLMNIDFSSIDIAFVDLRCDSIYPIIELLSKTNCDIVFVLKANNETNIQNLKWDKYCDYLMKKTLEFIGEINYLIKGFVRNPIKDHKNEFIFYIKGRNQ